LKIIRWILGRIILLVDALTSPTPLIREPAHQREIDDRTSSMAIYQFETCPFCVKVRRELRRQSLSIELRDAKNDLDIKAELVREGGRHKVPCLRTDNPDGSIDWLYESTDIIAHLQDRFSLGGL
jgi:glutaredoxin